MSTPDIARQIVDLMYNNDPMSQWLGIERVIDAPGNSVLRLMVRPEMLNGFAIAHGSITYALADSALAFASNAHGTKAVSVETSISHLKPVQAGDTLETEVQEVSLTTRTGIYLIYIKNQRNERVALFKGVVHRTDKPWL
jgi:acyl-CoA thioesterase